MKSWAVLGLAGVVCAALVSSEASAGVVTMTAKNVVPGYGAGYMQLSVPSTTTLTSTKVIASCYSSGTAPCPVTVANGTTVTIVSRSSKTGTTVNPLSGTGDAAPCNGNMDCSFVVTGDSTVSGTYQIDSVVRITTQGYGTGSFVASTPSKTLTCPIQPPQTCNARMAAGSALTFTASPTSPSTFLTFSSAVGDAVPCNGKASPCSVTATTTGSTLYGVFNSGSVLAAGTQGTGSGYVIFYAPNGGQVILNMGQTASYDYPPNTKVNMSAHNAAGSVFSGWKVVSGAPSGPMCDLQSATCSFTLGGKIAVNAIFNKCCPVQW